MSMNFMNSTGWISTPVIRAGLFTALLAGISALGASTAIAEEGIAIPAPALDEPAGQGASATAVLAGGCF
jgi:hypothetical protein